jgi:hypothetical protein
MVLDELPPGCRPLVQVVDDWFTNRKLGLLVEAQVGAGELIVCSINLLDDASQDPVTRQFLHSLLVYASSSAFRPGIKLSSLDIKNLFRQKS